MSEMFFLTGAGLVMLGLVTLALNALRRGPQHNFLYSLFLVEFGCIGLADHWITDDAGRIAVKVLFVLSMSVTWALWRRRFRKFHDVDSAASTSVESP